MLKQLKKYLIDLSKEICSESTKTAGEICDKTKKVNADFVKAIMESI
jgi:hypothetical protein|tara:strand:- start:1703 stop:1843 length:141 start_codon:yes stop_codon:yes gene_type:complete